MDAATSPPTDGEVKWSIGPMSDNHEDIKIKESSENCNGTNIKENDEEDMLAPIIGGVCGFCFVVLIILRSPRKMDKYKNKRHVKTY